MSYPPSGLGLVALEEGRIDEALALLERAQVIEAGQLSDPELLGSMRFGLARALHEKGVESKRTLERALGREDLERVGLPGEATQVQRWLAAR